MMVPGTSRLSSISLRSLRSFLGGILPRSFSRSAGDGRIRKQGLACTRRRQLPAKDRKWRGGEQAQEQRSAGGAGGEGCDGDGEWRNWGGEKVESQKQAVGAGLGDAAVLGCRIFQTRLVVIRTGYCPPPCSHSPHETRSVPKESDCITRIYSF
jgi:hypothetical protein